MLVERREKNKYLLCNNVQKCSALTLIVWWNKQQFYPVASCPSPTHQSATGLLLCELDHISVMHLHLTCKPLISRVNLTQSITIRFQVSPFFPSVSSLLSLLTIRRNERKIRLLFQIVQL